MDSINSPTLVAVSGISSSTLKLRIPTALLLSSVPVNRQEIHAASTVIIDVPADTLIGDRILSSLVAYPRTLHKKVVYVVSDTHTNLTPETRSNSRYWICKGAPFDDDATLLYDWDKMMFSVVYL